jgi:hypothetical protein
MLWECDPSVHRFWDFGSELPGNHTNLRECNSFLMCSARELNSVAAATGSQTTTFQRGTLYVSTI